jgi:hypothetical protein
MNAVKFSALALLATLGLEGTLRAEPPPIPGPGGVSPVPAATDAANQPAPATNGTPAAQPSQEDVEANLARGLKTLNTSIDELLAIPQTPAAFAVGATGEAVARPGTLRDATLQLASLYDSNGNLKPGFNAEFAPFRVLFEDQTLAEWQKNANAGNRLLDSVRLSLATAKEPTAATTDAPTLVSFGLRLSILDDRDYRRNPDFVKAVAAALQTCFPSQVKPDGGGIFAGKGFTQIDASDACKSAQAEQNAAVAKEAELRQAVAAAQAAKEEKDAAVVAARKALSEAQTNKVGEDAALAKLEGLDAAAAPALKPVIEQARADQAKATTALELAQARLTEADQAAATAQTALADRQQEHGDELKKLQSSTSKIGAINDASDFIQLRHDLETKYLNQGHRLELATANVLTKTGGTGEAKYRQFRGWLAYEYAWGKGSVGAAGDLSVTNNEEKNIVLDGDKKLVDGRLGARLNFQTGGVDAALAAGWAALGDRNNRVEYGGTIDLKFTALGAVRAGLLASTPFDGSPTALMAVLAVSGASGESIYQRSYSNLASGGAP